MIKAIIFDLDGVLIESEKYKAVAWDKMLKEYGVEKGGEWYTKRAGIPRKDLAEMAIKEFSIPTNPDVLVDKKQKIYLDLVEKGVEPVHSCITFLESISKESLKIGLASSNYKEIITKQLRQINILNHFDAITSGIEEVEKDKPSPDIYLLTAKKLNVNPRECIAVEDAEAGVASVKAAGMYCVGYQNPNTKNQDLSNADIVIDDFSSLTLAKIKEKIL